MTAAPGFFCAARLPLPDPEPPRFWGVAPSVPRDRDSRDDACTVPGCFCSPRPSARAPGGEMTDDGESVPPPAGEVTT